MTIESFGDLPKEAIDSTADELFSRAKDAVWRQIGNPKIAPETVASASQPKNNGGGNGNGGNGKDRPTEKQINVIEKFIYGLTPDAHSRLWKFVLGREIGSYADLNRKEASKVVEGIIHNRAQLRQVMIHA